MPALVKAKQVEVGIRGDCDGPGSSTDNAIARFDSTTGKLLQNSGVIVDDNDKITGPTTITFGEFNIGDSGTTKTIDYNNGQKQRITLTANCTITLTAPTSGEGNFILKIIQNATGGFSITWPASVKTPGTTATISALTANQYTIANFYHDAANNDNLSIPKDVSDNAIPFT